MPLIHTVSTHKNHAAFTKKELAQDHHLRLTALLTSIMESYAPSASRTNSEKANFEETLVRAYRAWEHVYGLTDTREMVSRKIERLETKHKSLMKSKISIYQDVEKVLRTGFPMESPGGDAGIITQGPISAWGCCPHHLLPVSYDVFVSYQPSANRDGTVLGLSKLARIAKLLIARPVLQEQATIDIADALHFDPGSPEQEVPQMRSRGSAVQLVGHHWCMACRGVGSNALTLTTVLRGSYSNDSLKSEFYQAIQAIRDAEVATPTRNTND